MPLRRVSGNRAGCSCGSSGVSAEREARMNPFEFERATDASHAVQALRDSGKFLAGGTNLIDLMKNGVERPSRLIDINRVALASIDPLPDGGVRLGALARNSDTANHPLVRQKYPLL